MSKPVVTEEMVEAAFTVAPLNYFQPRGDGEGFIRCSINTGEIREMLEAALSASPAEPVAWMDEGTLRSGSHGTAYRVITTEQKQGMPDAVRNSFNVPLYLHPAPTETDTIIAWYGRNGTEWRRKDNKSPAAMTKPREYYPAPAETERMREALERLVKTYADMQDGDGNPCPDVQFALAALGRKP